jgi:glycosyltransferase involved in cell wall biosynthesis
VTPQKPLPVSVCIIAGNEAARIHGALESVAGWTSEIIVVLDEKPGDNTGEIALSFGAKVFREPWKGHAAHRNFASEKAGQPWLFGLDADEEVSPELRDEIIRVLTTSKTYSLPAAYSFPRCTFYCGRWIRHGDWYPDRKVRLWQRGQGQWAGSPHEKLIIQGSVGRLQSELLHYSMDSLEHQIKKTISSANYFVQECADHRREVSQADLVFRPWWRFMRGYFLRRGFLDGHQGFIIAWMTAFYTFLRYAKVREAQAGKNGYH